MSDVAGYHLTIVVLLILCMCLAGMVSLVVKKWGAAIERERQLHDAMDRRLGHSDDDELACPYCGGSGHKDDVR